MHFRPRRSQILVLDYQKSLQFQYYPESSRQRSGCILRAWEDSKGLPEFSTARQNMLIRFFSVPVLLASDGPKLLGLFLNDPLYGEPVKSVANLSPN
jgi:hypothetical protein